MSVRDERQSDAFIGFLHVFRQPCRTFVKIQQSKGTLFCSCADSVTLWAPLLGREEGAGLVWGDTFCWLHPCYGFFFYFFVKPDRRYLESLHLTDFLGIKCVPGEVSISLSINFKGNRITEMTEQAFDFHFRNLLPFLAQLMPCILVPVDSVWGRDSIDKVLVISSPLNLICCTIKIFQNTRFYPRMLGKPVSETCCTKKQISAVKWWSHVWL